MADILIKDGYIITMDAQRRILERGSVAIEGDKITAVGKDVQERADTVIDVRGKAVLPGLINAHTHLSMTLLRGVADDMPLMEWLETKIWPIEKNLTAQDSYLGALLGCLEMIKSGTTCFADQYFFMQDVARAVEEAGLRAMLSYGIIEMDDPKRRESELRAGEKLVKTCQGAAGGRIQTMFGPHAAYTCSPECLIQVKELAKKYKVGIHTHISETQDEVDKITKKYGKRPVEHLDSIGFLGPEVLVAHCIWLTEKEIAVIRKQGVKPVHNPVSNMKTASGVAPVPEMLAAGIPVALGTDGAASNNSLDMFSEMKFAALLSKAHKLDPTALPAQVVLEMATINGAIALGLQDKIGSLEVGKKADIVMVDMKKPHLAPLHNVISHLVYSAVGGDVDTVVVDGKVLMRERRVLTLDEVKVLEETQKAADDLLARREAAK
ncbi:MAG: N-ethylammeline chlorohydrolase [Hadesarchaea archaeon B3_Hades]|nr:MAG: N-ethylammeline chlorohydrolase [Hadesarchaea archaeon B3_Hades]